MKKFIFAACAAMVLFFGSCQKSAKQEAIDLINATTEKVEKAKTSEEAQKYATKMFEDLQELFKKNPDLANSVQDDKEINAAMDKCIAAGNKIAEKEAAAFTSETTTEEPAAPASDADEATADENTAE